MIPSGKQAPHRRVLIVSPHFAPINAPDMQRTRLALPYLRDCGWEPTVLAVAPEMVEGGVLDPRLEKTYPADIRVVRVRGIPPWATRWAGIGSIWLRCGGALAKAGEKLLSTEKFDLVFFSTTQFEAFSLGPRWRAKFGVPYVLDYHDPWINDYYSRTKTPPPGGRLKFAFSQWRARHREPIALKNASGVIAVSTAYGPTLAKNHPWFDAQRVTFLPFGAAENDFTIARSHEPAQSLVPFGDGYMHFVYAGRCGPDMSTALTIIFRAFKQYKVARPDEANRVRFHFIGTDYAPRPLGREWVMPTARAEGIESFVSEHCYRVPYFDALYYLTHADALIAIGSNDPTYSASKIFPYVLARRPLLAVFNFNSPVLKLADAMKCGQRYAFKDVGDINKVANEIANNWFLNRKMKELVEADLGAFRPFSAESMTGRLAQCFNSAIDRAREVT